MGRQLACCFVLVFTILPQQAVNICMIRPADEKFRPGNEHDRYKEACKGEQGLNVGLWIAFAIHGRDCVDQYFSPVCLTTRLFVLSAVGSVCSKIGKRTTTSDNAVRPTKNALHV